jgi:RNA polymerase sigma-32 factor
MSPEEELAVTREYARTRDPRVARRIASANLRLVITVAVRYARRSQLPLAELVQEGTIGLMEAIERYDPERGVRFASYATWWIRAFILKYLLDNSRLVRAGRSRADRQQFLEGRAPAAEVSLDAPVGVHGDPLMDFIPAPGELEQSLEEAEARAMVRRRAAEFERRLDGRKAAIFRERFLEETVVPLRKLATRFSVSRERIRQIEKEVVDGFRDFALAA